MKLKLIPLAAATLLAATLASAPAHADLVRLTDTDLTGQGVGATFTVLTLQGQGSATTESGYVGFDGTTFGDALTGASQSRTFNFGDLGITNASQLGLIVNLNEPGSESPPTVTATLAMSSFSTLANRISLNVFSSSGMFLETHTLASNMTLEQVGGGVGGSGLVFGLTLGEQTQLNTTLGANAGAILAVGATFADSQGGIETIQAVRLDRAVAAIPEPETYALLLAGLGALGFVARRRKSA